VVAIITGSAVLTCFGDGRATFSALLRGDSGVGPLRGDDTGKLSVTRGYHIDDDPSGARSFRPSRWLTRCLRAAVRDAGLDPAGRRVAVVVGTGLRELGAVEARLTAPAHRLHFGSAVRAVVPDAAEILTISNACSAGGHALAIAQDLVESGEADAAIAAGTDATTVSMLAMIGRVTDAPAEQVRPFDADRAGVLLGDGAAAVVVEPSPATTRAPPGSRPLARLLATELSCDACHETAPDPAGIRRAMVGALDRSGLGAADVGLVVAHGTGTFLNDPVEAALIRDVLAADSPGPLITAVKGAVGHTSGGSALLSVDVAMRCMAASVVPPITGLCRPLSEGAGLRFVIGRPEPADVRVAQVNAFGFGGLNSVTLLEAPP
jgi:3-oxoacyl-[acyl-carrier-protein] synthase II